MTDARDPPRDRDDLGTRKALIADGHHRYATYRELQANSTVEHGAGPWDRGLTLLVDSSDYGPQVHAIHRVITGLTLTDALAAVSAPVDVTDVASVEDGLAQAADVDGFAAVLTDGARVVVLADRTGSLTSAASRADEPASLGQPRRDGPAPGPR